MRESQRLFETFRQGENEVYSRQCLARWDTQVKGLAELERRCQDLVQEVKLLSERQASSDWPFCKSTSDYRVKRP